MIKRFFKEYPSVLCLILFTIHYLSGYPGGMTPDSMDQFKQSLSFSFNSHHPPLMAMLWSLLNYIYAGPQIMLLLHLSLLWGGVLFLYYADGENKYRWLYFIIPFVPNVLAQSTMIWKDIGFGNSFFFIFAGCVYYLYKKTKAPLWVSVVFLLITFYALSIKFQSQFIVPVLVFFIVSISSNKRLFFRICMSSILSLMLIFTNSLIIDKFSVNTNSWQLRQFFDIASIVKDLDDDSMLPDYVKQSKRYNFDTLKKNFTHHLVNHLVFPEDRIYTSTQDKVKLESLNQSFYKLIISHPFLYLKHRLLNFIYVVKCSYSNYEEYSSTEYKDELRARGINVTTIEFLKQPISFMLKIYPNIFRSNTISVALICLFFVTLYKNSRPFSKENVILSYIVLIGIIYSLTLFFTTMANDYRYYYIVRLLTFFAIPIFLKFWQSVLPKIIIATKHLIIKIINYEEKNDSASS